MPTTKHTAKHRSITRGALPPFRMLTRSYSDNIYRFGFQGQEYDNEWYGNGNLWAYKYRLEDARLGRFFSPDPLFAKYPHNSSYAFSENRVIDGIELEGLEYQSTGKEGTNWEDCPDCDGSPHQKSKKANNEDIKEKVIKKAPKLVAKSSSKIIAKYVFKLGKTVSKGVGSVVGYMLTPLDAGKGSDVAPGTEKYNENREELKKNIEKEYSYTQSTTNAKQENNFIKIRFKEYQIKKGDTFWDLERKYNLKHGSLQKLNPNKDPKKLKVGTVINIAKP